MILLHILLTAKMPSQKIRKPILSCGHQKCVFSVLTIYVFVVMSTYFQDTIKRSLVQNC